MKSKGQIARVLVSYYVMSTHRETWKQHLLTRWMSTGKVDNKLVVSTSDAAAMIETTPPRELQIGGAFVDAGVARLVAGQCRASGCIGTKIVVNLHAVTMEGGRERLPDQSISLDGVDMPVAPDLGDLMKDVGRDGRREKEAME